jgi:putative endonuclease
MSAEQIPHGLTIAGESAPSRDHARRALGLRGESLAAEHLRARGCVVLARNVRTPQGEIDLIARDGEALAFVEVKTRRVGTRQLAVREDQEPLHGFTVRQRARLRRAAVWWLREDAPRSRSAMVRFDAIGVVIDSSGRLRQIEHVEDAW